MNKHTQMVLLLTILLLVACGGQQPAAQPPTQPQTSQPSQTETAGAVPATTTPAETGDNDTRETLRVAHEVLYGGDETLDPSDLISFWSAMPMIYDTLAHPDDTWHPAPELATSWETNDDATIWTFTLRDDVTFHNGKPLTSEDVAYTIAHILDPERSAVAQPVLQIIEQVETPDEHTVIVHLAQPHAELPSLFMGFQTAIIPAGSGETIGTTGIGTGPFKIETLDVIGTTHLVANDSYWQGKPGLAAIDLIGIPEASARIQAFQAGQVDSIYELTPQEARQLEAMPDITIDQRPSGIWMGYGIRTDTPPFDDARVRKAMRLVVDRQQILDLTYDGQGTVSCDTPVWSGDPHRWNGQCPQDIDQAKRLLAEAGYPDGIDVTLFTTDAFGYFIPMAEVYQQQAAAAGIRVTIEQKPAAGYWNEVLGVEPFFSASEVHYPADFALHLFYSADSSFNSIHWDNPHLVQLLRDAQAEQDPAKRTERYQAVQQFLFDESGLLIVYHIDEIQAYRNVVSGIPSMNRFYAPWHEVTKTEK